MDWQETFDLVNAGMTQVNAAMASQDFYLALSLFGTLIDDILAACEAAHTEE